MKRILQKTTALLLALALLAALFGGCAKKQDGPRVIVIGHSDTAANLINISLEHFAQAVEERSGGRLQVRIFPAEQLGANAEMAQMVEMGKLDAMMIPAGQQAALCPKFKALGLPFLFEDYQHVYRVLDGEIGQELLEGLDEHNMVQIAYWENGLRQITNSVRPIEHPEDLSGLHFRTPQDDMTIAIFEAYGASASPYAFSELYVALQQGLFDGQENPVANIYANHFDQVQPYLTMVNYQYQPKNMIFSKSLWEELPEDLRDILSQAAREFGDEHRAAVADSEAQMLQELEARGMDIGAPDPAPFIQTAQNVYEDFYRENDWARDLVERIVALKEQ